MMSNKSKLQNTSPFDKIINRRHSTSPIFFMGFYQTAINEENPNISHDYDTWITKEVIN